MSTFKRTKVVMLPTENKSNIYKNDQGIMTYNTHPNFGRLGWKPQHLYFLSDDKIQEGDWYMWTDNQAIAHSDDMLDYLEKHRKAGDVKKVIATTDKSLLVKNTLIRKVQDVEMKGNHLKALAEPSKGFIEKFVKKGGIDEVEVEYGYKIDKSSGHFMQTRVYFLKVSSDNTITVKPIKNSWNRKEVEELLYQFYTESTNSNYSGSFNSWIKENL